MGFIKNKDRCRLSWERIQWDQYHVYINPLSKMLPDAILLITIYQNYQPTIAKDSISTQSLHAANKSD